jgi:hypothetical protein
VGSGSGSGSGQQGSKASAAAEPGGDAGAVLAQKAAESAWGRGWHLSGNPRLRYLTMDAGLAQEMRDALCMPPPGKAAAEALRQAQLATGGLLGDATHVDGVCEVRTLPASTMPAAPPAH